jgi:hypothetical protein
MTAQLLGLLGHVLTKAHLLTVTRRVIDQYAESNRDGQFRFISGYTAAEML